MERLSPLYNNSLPLKVQFIFQNGMKNQQKIRSFTVVCEGERERDSQLCVREEGEREKIMVVRERAKRLSPCTQQVGIKKGSPDRCSILISKETKHLKYLSQF